MLKFHSRRNYLLRCSSAREGEDEVEDGGGGTLLDVEPGKKKSKLTQTKNKHRINKHGTFKPFQLT